jgi:hypothetical protein
MALETALNWMSWPVVGDVANITQLTGLDAVQLIGMIGTAANNARMHKKNCLQFAHHLKLISNLLEKVTLSELTPETQEALALFENALRKALVLVQHCSNKSYIYLVAMGWVYVNKFRECQDEIDRYLNLIPLISLVEGSRNHLKAIEKDCEQYTLEEEQHKVRESLKKRQLSREDSCRLSRQLSEHHPGLPITEALQKEKEMVRNELEIARVRMEVEPCNVIEHFLEVTDNDSILG